jgi:hypothetical protein
MGLHHGGFHIAVAEQLLNRADVGALLQKVLPLDVLPWIPPGSALRIPPLPAPFPGRIALFPLKGMGQLHSAPACREIGLVLALLQIHILDPQVQRLPVPSGLRGIGGQQ